MNNILFLDYDGVVNCPEVYEKYGEKFIGYNFPKDGKVNNPLAVNFVSMFCEKYGYDIVVTSTWREEKNYKGCLYEGGLSENVRVLGRTSLTGSLRYDRYSAIIDWMVATKMIISNYIILDDDDFVPKSDEDMKRHLVLTNPSCGVTIDEYDKMVEIHSNGVLNEKIYKHHGV